MTKNIENYGIRDADEREETNVNVSLLTWHLLRFILLTQNGFLAWLLTRLIPHTRNKFFFSVYKKM
jgi:hypothetical protein